MSVIDVTGLTKHYGEVRAVRGIDFTVEEGEVFGFLGPNGAGKTTTIRTMLGLLNPTAGRATVLGADSTDEPAMIEAKRSIGYLPANPAFDDGATGREILDLHGSIKGEQRREELLELFEPPLDREVRDYSSGNRQKLGVVQAFMHDPELVIMDEPTSGLDPLMQQRFNEFVRAEREQGVTVFFSSHVLSEVRRVCDRVAILRDGELVTTEAIESLLDRSGKFVRARIAGHVESDAFNGDTVHGFERTLIEDRAEELLAATDFESDADVVTEVRFTYTGDINDLVTDLASYSFVDLDVEEAPLEEVFMRFYGPGEPSERTARGQNGDAAPAGGDGNA
ncbi:ABC transporter ATP-binding protein [Halapricum hydrolyticum]|uniref:ABC transporter ATP-binding protein n=1 Tax=Halapricum hydrolyticum TaxID=2979991 RepID=A0AAE3LEC6_9EURY|nr:ABC transporter ATP-binding protein [Halapricum hydrolyticum]MCU4717270.1 ABC transporter ATP-binding protein [Halapricum hydrolyticum]MCU4726197.1 ABC transporter ATP-binding protein [Halapricum hydrolyticum]